MQVEIWSDVVCPWCYIGKRRFEAALARFDRRERVEVTWRSFELDPSAPARVEGDLEHMLAAKYGMTPGQAREANARLTRLAAAEGLEYRLRDARMGNTFDAHRLLHLAADRGVQGAVKERFMRGYFTEGAAIGDPDVLAELAGSAGLDPAEARAVLDSDRYAEAVRGDEREAAELGIRGVPFFVLGRTCAVSGAQPADLLLEALLEAEGHAATPS